MEHTLSGGVELIDAVERLGESLGYEPQREYPVGRSAAVDMAWINAAHDQPLFVIEIESTASAGIANNAMKVFGPDSNSLVKPLFFFHLVLKGGPDNERIRNAQRTWGAQNYRVYRFTEGSERRRFIADVLQQHRRVVQDLDPLHLARALTHEVWDGNNAVIDALAEAERLGFDALFARSYAILAFEDPRFERQLAARLRKLYGLSATEWNNSSRASYLPGLLEIAIRIHTSDISDADGPAAFEGWMNLSAPDRMIDAILGRSRDYDDYIMGHAPLDYALATGLLLAHPASRDWLVQDLYGLLARMRARNVTPLGRSGGLTWLAHLLAAIPDSQVVDVDACYATLQTEVQGFGGLPAEILLSPPGDWGAMNSDPPDWVESTEKVMLPERHELAELVAGTHVEQAEQLSSLQWVLAGLAGPALDDSDAQLIMKSLHEHGSTGKADRHRT